jgi:Patatin-like phospholipase
MLSVENAREWRPPARWIVFVAVWVVWVGLAMGQLNDLLAAMHVSGSPSFTVSDVNSFFHAGPDRAQSTAVLGVWKAQAASAATGVPEAIQPATAEDVATLFVLIDSVLFVPLYALLFLLFFRRAERGELTRVRRLARLGSYAVLGTAFFDLVENLGIGNVVERGWDLDLGQDPSALDTWLWILWVGALLKWSLGGLTILLAILVGWEQLSDWREERRSRATIAPTIRPGHLVGFQVVVVAAAIVLFNQEGQLADLYRRWQAVQLTLSLVSLTFAAFAVWVVTRRLLVRGPWKPDRTPERERRVARLAFAAIVALALAQLIAHLLLDEWLFDPGWGLVVPAGILAAVALLGWPMERPGAETDPAEPEVRPDAGPDPKGQLERVESGTVLPRLLACALLIGFGVALLRSSFGYAVYTRQWSWEQVALLVGGAAVGAVVVPRLVRLLPRPTGLPRRMVEEPLTGAALVTLGVAIALSGTWQTDEVSPAVLVGLSFLLVSFALRWYVALGREPPPPERPAVGSVTSAALAATLLPLLFLVFPLRAGQWFSAPGVICVFLMSLVLVSGLLAWIGTGIPLPRALRAIGLKHFPVTSLLILWFLVASFGDRAGAYHDARIDDADAVATPLSAQDALGCWLGRHGLDLAGTTAAPPNRPSCETERTSASTGPIPLVFVASTGGGIRSAYWTALAVDCAFEINADSAGGADPCPDEQRTTDFGLSDSLFLTSGISGGSLGLAEYAAYLVAKEHGAASRDWVETALAVDGLSPSGARWLFVEIPRVFLQFDGPDDRAAILERAWEARWPDRELETGLFELAERRAHVPFLLFNSTSVGDGCRFNVSVLDASIEVTDGPRPACRSNAPFDEAPLTPGDSPAPDTRVGPTSALPATRDLGDLLCRKRLDLNLSTAALLSARFPFVNPSGRVASRCDDDPRPAVVHGVDGGYLDTSGASPIVELMDVLGPELEGWNAEPAHAGTCIVPFMIQIDNGFEDSSPPRGGRRPAELMVPLQTVFDTRIGRAAEARTAAAQLFTRPFRDARLDYPGGRVAVTDRYAHFVNQAHPGPAAPFGWAQSRFSQRELEGQLSQSKNRQALSEIRAWRKLVAEGDLTCATATRQSP